VRRVPTRPTCRAGEAESGQGRDHYVEPLGRVGRLGGEDARTIDAAVRAKPEAAYDHAELFKMPAEERAAGKPASRMNRCTSCVPVAYVQLRGAHIAVLA
jgi:hypothetical protein